MRSKLWALIVVIPLSYAIVPTIDQYQLSQDVSTMTDYGYNLGNYLNKLSQALTSIEQVRQLNGLAQISGAGKAICELCTPTERKHLLTYIQQVDSDLCSQFSFALNNITGLTKSIQSINDIIAVFKSNPKAAGLALQQAAIQTGTAMQNTLNQIQMLFAQQSQKELAEEKLERQDTNDAYSGFGKSGL